MALLCTSLENKNIQISSRLMERLTLMEGLNPTFLLGFPVVIVCHLLLHAKIVCFIVFVVSFNDFSYIHSSIVYTELHSHRVRLWQLKSAVVLLPNIHTLHFLFLLHLKTTIALSCC